jgi:ribosomal protein L11 methyltransferase
MPLLALRLEVNQAHADALSDALLAAGAESVFVALGESGERRLEALIDAGADTQALVHEAAAFAGLHSAPPFRLSPVEEQDWIRRSQAQFAPLLVGERLWVGASWHKPPPGARAVVRLDPGLAFGTGSHSSTRLVLRFLEKEVQGFERVLDYGCGSGILAIAAAKLGAARSDGVDIDPQALEATVANARANAVQVRATLPEALASEPYDIVVANILAKPLIVLAPLLGRLTRRGGSLALSGILESQSAEVAGAYADEFDCKPTLLEDGWALIEATRR